MKISSLTWKDYHSVINSTNKRHPSDAYDYTLAKYERFAGYDDSKKDNEELIQQSVFEGIRVNFYRVPTDKRDFQYVKHDEDGNILRDEKGEVTYFTKEELEKKFEGRLITYDIRARLADTGQVIAQSQDEWGAQLFTTARELRGLGIGSKLKELYLQEHPEYQSGGLTNSGYNLAFRSYQKEVQKALQSGEYTQAVKNGDMDASRVKEILASADIIGQDGEYKRNRRRSKIEDSGKYNMKDPADLALIVGDNYAILYNKKIIELEKKQEDIPVLTNQGIAGYCYVGGVYDTSHAPPKLFRNYGQNEKIEKFMAEVALNTMVGYDVQVHQDDLHLLPDRVLESASMEKIKFSQYTKVNLPELTIKSLPILREASEAYFRKHDPYQEAMTLIQESASALAEEAFERELEEKKQLEQENDDFSP